MQAGSGGAAAAARWPASFSVSYSNPPALTGAFWYAWQTMLVVLLVLGGGPVWVWRVSVVTRPAVQALPCSFAASPVKCG
jgi:hypothetical protein